MPGEEHQGGHGGGKFAAFVRKPWVWAVAAGLILAILIARRFAGRAGAEAAQPELGAAGGLAGGGYVGGGGEATAAEQPAAPAGPDIYQQRLEAAQAKQAEEEQRHAAALNLLGEQQASEQLQEANVGLKQKQEESNISIKQKQFEEQQKEELATSTQAERTAAEKAKLNEQAREQRIGQHCPSGYKPSFDAQGNLTCQKKGKKVYARIVEPVLDAVGQVAGGLVRAGGQYEESQVLAGVGLGNPYAAHNAASTLRGGGDIEEA